MKKVEAKTSKLYPKGGGLYDKVKPLHQIEEMMNKENNHEIKDKQHNRKNKKRHDFQ